MTGRVSVMPFSLRLRLVRKQINICFPRRFNPSSTESCIALSRARILQTVYACLVVLRSPIELVKTVEGIARRGPMQSKQSIG